MEVAIYLTYVGDVSAADVRACEGLLSDHDRLQRDRYTVESARRQFTIRRAALRWALSQHGRRAPADWEFKIGPRGRPDLLGESTLGFSVADTRELIVCAISQGVTIGVDAEPLDREVEALQIAEHAFALEELRELEALAGADRQRRFLEYWTLKEAYVKALGVGLGVETKAICFALDDHDAPRLQSSLPETAASHEWSFRLFDDARGHVLALACCAPRLPTIRTRAGGPVFTTRP